MLDRPRAAEVPSATPDIKEELAAEAVKIVTGARRAAYGKPERNFERIVRLWNAHLQNRGLLPVTNDPTQLLEPSDVALLIDLMKTARLAESPNHRDSIVDKIGYTLCYGEIALAEESPFESGDFVEILASETPTQAYRRARDMLRRKSPLPDKQEQTEGSFRQAGTSA